MDLSEKLTISLTVLITGFVVVFAVLILLILLIMIYGAIVSKIQKSADGKKAKKENERHYVKRETAMAGVFAGEALSGMIWAILRELNLTL